MSTTTPRRFRFGLRSLFVVVVIVAIPCAWVGYAMNWIRQRQAFLRRPGVGYGGVTMNMPDVTPPWQLRLFGEEGLVLLRAPKGDWEEARLLFPEVRYLEDGHTAAD